MSRPPRASAVSTALGRGALLACSALTVISGSTLAPALPSIRRAFASTSGVEWLVRLVVTLPALAIALAAPWVGRLADRIGPRRVLLSCLVLYAFSGASGLFARGLADVLVGRALLGASAAGLMTASTAIAATELDPAGRMRFFARQASVMSLAGVVSVVVGGLLAAEHWRAPFGVYLAALPIAAAALGHVASDAPRAAGAAPPSAEHLAGEPPAFRRTRGLVYAAALGAMGFVFMVPLQVPFLLAHEGPRIAGLAVATSSLCAAASALLAGRRAPGAASATTWMARSLAVMGAGYVVVGSAGGTPAILFAGLAVGGIGSGWIMPELSRALVAASSARTRSAAIGALTSSVYAGQFLSPALSALFGARRSLSLAFLASGGALVVLALALHVARTLRRRAR